MNAASIPAELRERRQWVVWRTEKRDDKPTKVPYVARPPQERGASGTRRHWPASTTDPSTWRSFLEAVELAKGDNWDGIGYVFAQDDPYCGVDLDKCRNGTGLLPDAALIVFKLDSYAEWSPSGTGAHVLLKARLPGTRRRKDRVEMYDQGRYFAMTGDHIEGTPTTIEERQAELEAVYAAIFPPQAPAAAASATTTPLELNDQELLRRAATARNGDDFERLWEGDTSGHGSHSEADLALCGLLAFWTGRDPGRIDALFRRSALMREKWDSRRGESTYGAQTIEAALRGGTEFYERRPAQPAATVPTETASRGLAEVIETFERNLYLPDPGVVYVALATVAANRLEGDPSWTVIVGPSSGGKTEVLNAVSGLNDVHHAGTLTEASLLSGTPSRDKAKGARGGLLRVIGDRGLLVCKDFGSVLSMHRDARAATLSALREIYDGSWDRHVGTDGGRSLHWDGKLGLIAGATPAIDQHHGALAVLGDRFVFYRLQLEDASEQARRSLDNTRRIGELRAELRDAVSGLFSGLELDGGFPAFDAGDTERLVALATLVVRCRSAVIRDTYQSREVELVPDAEAPGRLIGALGRLLAALRLIGVDDGRAWAIVVKTGLDSMPVLRRRVLELLLAGEGAQETGEVAARLDLPTTTTKRVLEDLTAHGVLRRNTAPKGEAHSWEAVDWTRLQYRNATEPEMSEHLMDVPL
jgi:putative DNA primase/helicase